MVATMPVNLLPELPKSIDLFELRIALGERYGDPGQYLDLVKNPYELYLPLAGPTCKISLTFKDGDICRISPGPALDASEWAKNKKEIEQDLLLGPTKFGRDIAFSSYRVEGSWRGVRSGVQILPPLPGWARVPYEMGNHPFILEFPIIESNKWTITNHRRRREHRRLTLLLNVLLAGNMSFQTNRPSSGWAVVHRKKESGLVALVRPVFTKLGIANRLPNAKDKFETVWVQKQFLDSLDTIIKEGPSAPANAPLPVLGADTYFSEVGHDGRGLQIPSDLDELICLYQSLRPDLRDKFDRAIYWLQMSRTQWDISTSLSFTSLVSAIETLTVRGPGHKVTCDICKKPFSHDEPGLTELFRSFIETHAPGKSLETQRSKMYKLRSTILHGGGLMELDEDRAHGWDPEHRIQYDLHSELSPLTRTALRSWLKSANVSETVVI
jgi:hypothetical protein